MYTLIVIAYILISLGCTCFRLKDQCEYSTRSFHLETKLSFKKALKEGFLTPIIFVLVVLVAWLLAWISIQLAILIFDGIGWIYFNMP